MTSYEIYETEPFSKIYAALDKREQQWIDKMKQQLKENPKVGKPLKFDWFREKKFEDKRLYFFVSKRKPRILLVAFATKKDQQKIIDFLLQHKDEFLKLMDEIKPLF